MNEVISIPVWDKNLQDNNIIAYRLKAIINHIGDINSGHYTCNIRTDIDPEVWVEYNDRTVKIMENSPNNMYSSNAYILLYEKIKSN